MIFKMTIRTRNRINFFLIFISLSVIASIGILLPFHFFSGKLSVPTDIPYTQLQNFFLTRFNFFAVLISIAVFPVYAFIMLLYMNIEFEKTQSTEIIYFSIFLIACLIEPVRLTFPFNNLWHAETSLSLFSSTLTMFGRILATLSLLFAVIYNKTESRQYVEQNLLLLFVVSIYISILMPFNTQNALPLCHLDFGYNTVFIYSQLALFAAAILTQLIPFLQDTKQHPFPFGMILLCGGYTCLCNTYNFLLLIAGTALLFTGSISYLKALHTMYLWNDM